MVAVSVLFWLSAQYCVRQGTSAYLELWAFLLLLAGASIRTRKVSRVLSAGLGVLALLTAVLGASIFYGCSMTAPAQQGLGTDMPAATFELLRCLGWQPLGTATGWSILGVEVAAMLTLLVLAIVRWRKTARVFGLIGSGMLLALSCAGGFLWFFGFSWCTSSRLF